MLNAILGYSIRFRWSVVMIWAVMAAIGVYSYQRLPIDAVPDITNVQVQVNTEAEGYTPLEVEQRITFLVETGMAGIPGLKETRSISRYGLSQVTVIFDDGTDIYFARQQISERLQIVRGELPPGLEPSMGPIATGLGEIFMWTVDADPSARTPAGIPYSATDLRTLQDWVIAPQLRSVRGVTEINTIGGHEKQYLVAPRPERLRAYGLTMHDVIQALLANNATQGAGYIERSGEQYLVRSVGQLRNLTEVGQVSVGVHAGIPVRLSMVADIGEGKELRTGAATKDAREVVLGTVFMLVGENSREVSQRVAAKLADVNRALPVGVQANTVYDRTILVDKTIATVQRNLIEGAILVIAILFVMLGNMRAALITALVIPLSMLFAITGMVANGQSGNLMSLGAIDFGIIVDGAIVIVENAIRRLALERVRLQRSLTLSERLGTVLGASTETGRTIVFGQLIIMIVYLPILALTGIEGKMFFPMAFTVLTALAGAMLLSITLIPALVALVLTRDIRDHDNFVMRTAQRVYTPMLHWVLRNKPPVAAAAVVLVLLGGLVAGRMGTEFIPSLDEGDIALHALRIPGTSLSQSVTMQYAVERAAMTVPEVSHIFSKIGTAEVATDPMPPSVADTFVMLRPRDQWPDPARPKHEVVSDLAKAVQMVPGNNYEFTQPIQMRFNELIAGVRSDVAVKVFGDDMQVLLETGNDIEKILKTIPGAEDVKVEQITGLPSLIVEYDNAKAARYGLSVNDVQQTFSTAVGGRQAGVIFEGDRRVPLIVRLSEADRGDPRQWENLSIALPREGDRPIEFVPMGSVSSVVSNVGPNQISRENGKRRVVVTANVRGRDVGGFVREAQAKINAEIAIPTGYWTAWGGQFEQMISAAERLKIIVPLALLLILALLVAAFGSYRDAILVFTGVPMALTGGIFALAVRGIPLSISAGIGLIALCGVAVLNGVVLVTFINQLRMEGKSLDSAVIEGALARLRPVLMTALVASLGFVPMMLSTGTGAEVQRPLATVVVGGIVTSTILTLLVLPVLYTWFSKQAALSRRATEAVGEYTVA